MTAAAAIRDEENLGELDVPGNATRTSDFPIADEAWAAYLTALDKVEDMAIVLEIRVRPQLTGDVVELVDFIRQQGYDPAEFAG